MFLLKRENWDTISGADLQGYKGKAHDDGVKKLYRSENRCAILQFTLFYESKSLLTENGFKQGNCR